MADDEDIAALVIDNGSGMCKGTLLEYDVSGSDFYFRWTVCFAGMTVDIGIRGGAVVIICSAIQE